MGKRVRTPDELGGALHHLTYEVRMLLETAERLSVWVAGDVVMRNAFVEAYSVHARNVIESLVLGSRDRKVVTLDAFGVTLPLLEQCHVARMRRAFGEASARVAHVTWGRKVPNPGVELGTVGPLVERFLLLADKLPPDVPIDADTRESLEMVRRWSALHTIPPRDLGPIGPTGPVGP